MMRKKPYIEKEKELAEKRLSVLLETLRTGGMSDSQMQKDATVKHLKGGIRRAKYRLGCIAELEKQMDRKREIKAEKSAAVKTNQPKKRRAEGPAKKKSKADRKSAAVAVEEK